MDATDLTLQDVVLLPRAQDDPELAALLDVNVAYAQGDGATLPWPPIQTSQAPASVGGGGGGDGEGPSRARPRQERRSHTKSRRGCSNCKRRRIKCSEAQPACSYCVKKGFRCEYPQSPTIVHQPHDSIPLFSMQDMRCFQHFMLRCYPHHPVGNEDVWTHEVPCLSRSNEHLMHAILALAASDLTKNDPSLLPLALNHRLKSINSVKQTLSGATTPSSVTSESANALLATCVALTIQSVGIDDGMAEYMTFFRGLMVVGVQMWKVGVTPVFANLAGGGAGPALEPLMRGVPLVRGEWVDAAVRGIEGLGALCREGVEREYHGLLVDWARALYVSSWEGYKALERHYMWWVLLPHASFQALVDPANQTMLLLSSHWIALQQTMVSVTAAEARLRKKEPQERGGVGEGMNRWMRYLNRSVDAAHGGFNRWPVWVQGQVERDPYFFYKPGPGKGVDSVMESG